MGRSNIKDDAVKFSKDRQPSKEARARAGKKVSETAKKKRDLSELLQFAIKGEFGDEINKTLFQALGIKADTIEEALHFVQIAKAISQKDTQAYQALMQVSGISKPVKTELTGANGGPVVITGMKIT